jgi:tetratricopeptide (TPR) repeat protein
MKIACSLVLVFSATAALQAGTMVSFDTERNSAMEHEGGKTNTIERFGQHVFLGADLIDVEAGSQITVHDFKKRIKYRSVENKEGFTRSSLLSDIGFRVYEFKNRLMLGQALAAADIQDNPMDRVLMEHLFSLTSDEPANLKREIKSDAVAFSHNGKPLLEYNRKGFKVPSEMVETFTLYLRTAYGIHPDILKEIGGLDYLPQRIVLHRYNTAETEKIRLELKQVTPNASRPERKLNTEIVPDYDPVFALAHQVREMDAKAYAAACESILKRAPLMAEKGKYLDAACLFVGYGLASGKQEFPQSFFDWKEKIVADPDVQALFSALSPRSKEDAEKAVDTYAALAEKAGDGKFALMIFRANMLDSLDKPHEAIDSFLVALKQQPATVGAWKDLGDLYYKTYQAEKAWACWDAGRALNPGHKLFEEVHQMESSLLADHPEFFMETPSARLADPAAK